jgi:hypothetical protein
MNSNFPRTYYRFFNFMVRRVVAVGFMFAGSIFALLNAPALLPGGMTHLNGEPTTDIVLRCFSFFMPLIVVALGIALFRVKPFYPKGHQESNVQNT